MVCFFAVYPMVLILRDLLNIKHLDLGGAGI